MNKTFIKRSIMLLVDLVIVVLLVGLDQFTKHLAINRLKGQEAYVLIDGVLELQYLENRGSAFGMLQNQKILILFMGAIFLMVILMLLFRLPQQRKYCLLHILMSFIIAGGIGNMIDRIRFDYVVDFISFVLIHFPIFNVADCYIVCGVIALFILILFVFKEEDLEFLSLKKKHTES